MTKSTPIPFHERIVDAMTQLACASRSHRMILAGPNSPEIFLELHRRGFLRVTTLKLCDMPCGQFDVAVVASREHSIKALETTLNKVVNFLSIAGTLVVWVGPHERTPNETLDRALNRVGFRIEAGTCCENGVAVSARRLKLSPLAEVA
jgi:hypothetical protein